VLVLGKDDTLETRKLKTGLANWAFTEIAGGLDAGDRVLLSFEREREGRRKVGARAQADQRRPGPP
jgi:HlyD family secretion protein